MKSFEKIGRNGFASNAKIARRSSLFGMLERLIAPDRYFSVGLPLGLLAKVGCVLLLLLIYIGNEHYAEQTVRKINQLQAEVEDLRADYITLKADLMVAGKQSEIAQRVAPMGLKENDTPPEKVVVNDGEY